MLIIMKKSSTVAIYVFFCSVGPRKFSQCLENLAECLYVHTSSVLYMQFGCVILNHYFDVENAMYNVCYCKVYKMGPAS